MHHPERFLGLLGPHRERLFVISRNLVRRKADADDALQEALLKAWADFSRYREGRSFGAWVLGYLINTIRNRNRRLHHELEVSLPAELEDPVTILGRETSHEELLHSPDRVLEMLDEPLAQAILRLSTAERAVLLLRSVGELPYREIAAVLGIPEGTAMSHLSRARKRVRIFLGERAGTRGSPLDSGGRP
ncbi:MAG: RNA polymerase sigma factor [Planctomycetota bacterium]|nr:RNA polymerase sigma factor [Planctomycetota bacterium]